MLHRLEHRHRLAGATSPRQELFVRLREVLSQNGYTEVHATKLMGTWLAVAGILATDQCKSNVNCEVL
eukprot:1748659-Amphidinium_carterae.1